MSSDGNAFTNGMAAGQTWGRWAADRENEEELSDVSSQLRRYRARCKALETMLAELDKTYVSTDIQLAKAIERTHDLGQAIRKFDPNHPVLSPTVRDMTCRRAAMERMKVYAGEYRYDAVNDVVERIRK